MELVRVRGWRHMDAAGVEVGATLVGLAEAVARVGVAVAEVARVRAGRGSLQWLVLVLVPNIVLQAAGEIEPLSDSLL